MLWGQTQWNICDGRFLWDNPDDTQHHSPPVTSLPLTNLVSSLLLSLVLTAQGISYQILFQKVWIGKCISPSLSSIKHWFLQSSDRQVYLFNNVERNWHKTSCMVLTSRIYFIFYDFHLLGECIKIPGGDTNPWSFPPLTHNWLQQTL